MPLVNEPPINTERKREINRHLWDTQPNMIASSKVNVTKVWHQRHEVDSLFKEIVRRILVEINKEPMLKNVYSGGKVYTVDELYAQTIASETMDMEYIYERGRREKGKTYAKVHFTCYPWRTFNVWIPTFYRGESFMSITWDKIVEEPQTPGLIAAFANFTVMIHHACADGIAIAKAFNAIEAALAYPTIW